MFGLAHLAQTIKEGIEKMSAATDRLTASVQAATVAVDALVARIPPPAPPVDETPIVAAADALDALTTKVNAIDPAVKP
jgi:hypothetical protein